MEKFKIGDKLKCIAVYLGDYGAGWEKDKIGTVKIISKAFPNKNIYWFDEFEYGVYEEALELVENSCKNKKFFYPNGTKIKIGDRIVMIVDYGNIEEGVTGQVIDIGCTYLEIGIRYDLSNTNFHNCDNKCENDHGYYVSCDVIESINQEQNIKVKKMELKDCKKENLKIAKAKVEEERTIAEIEYAAQQYRYIINKIDSLDRSIKQHNDQIIELETEKKVYINEAKQFNIKK